MLHVSDSFEHMKLFAFFSLRFLLRYRTKLFHLYFVSNLNLFFYTHVHKRDTKSCCCQQATKPLSEMFQQAKAQNNKALKKNFNFVKQKHVLPCFLLCLAGKQKCCKTLFGFFREKTKKARFHVFFVLSFCHLGKLKTMVLKQCSTFKANFWCE